MAEQQAHDHHGSAPANTPAVIISGGLAGIGPLPAFDLPDTSGETVRSWDYKSRRHLVLWLAGARPDWHALAAVAAREAEVQAEGAVLVVIVRSSPEEAQQMRSAALLRGPVLVDGDGRVHARLEAEQPTLLVADRTGTIYWRASAQSGQPDMDEALSWLAYLNILEPECGSCVPAWPVESPV